MCDTLCALGPSGTLFAKNSDRPVAERQVVRVYPARRGGAMMATQYLEMVDTGAAAVMVAQPDWLWGAEHGVNEHGVAIGNERVDTVDDPALAPAGLIGMDLVRLGLERGRTAGGALDVITDLIEHHGQGGVCDRVFGDAYWSSFLVADPASAWVLETSGRTWVAEPVEPKGPADGGRAVAAIGNRLTLGRGWTRSSSDVAAGADFERWRDRHHDTAYADSRLAASRALLAGRGRELSPARLAGHLRDHGTGPWGMPAEVEGPGAPVGLPGGPDAAPGAPDFTVCMHVRQLMATTSAMVAWLPTRDCGTAVRAWVAPGSPCVSVFVPVFPFGPSGDPGDRVEGGIGHDATPACWADPAVVEQLAVLRVAVEGDGGLDHLRAIRAVLDPLEAALWAEADEVALQPDRLDRAAARRDLQVRSAIDRCVSQLGR